MRLDKLVSDSFLVTRSEARKLIKKGLVEVNGQSVKNAGENIDEKSSLKVNGKEATYKKFVYIMLNKPKGYVSACEDKNKKTVMELLPQEYKRYKLFPAGRLDIDTEGFLLITNDGNFAHNILSPSKKVGKTYFVRYDDAISDEACEALRKGVDIGECITKPAIIKRIRDNEALLTITEGKFHQIKRMAHAVGREVIYLKRLSYGGLFLDETLKSGEFRLLSSQEVETIYNVYK